MEIKTKTRMGALSGGGVLLLTAILVILNLLSQRLFFRWDWTAGRRYSLSSASKDLVRSLEDPVLIRAYISDGLPQPLATYGRYSRDLL
ncbi:MAG: Gldg family protein, partial [Elusimicrobia bacterium]|nr:Gldg family protein [Elusimicrobiota bacterium]